VHPQRLEQVAAVLARDLVQRVLHQVVPPHAHDAHVAVRAWGVPQQGGR
jgi:hypothetical protein